VRFAASVFLESGSRQSYNVVQLRPQAAGDKGNYYWRNEAMIKEIKGQLTAGKGKFAIVVSRFNEFITAKLLAGAVDCLQRHGAADAQMTIVWVPGACEITTVAKKLAQSGKFSAVICLGAVIRGQTSHYDYICQQAARGISQISYDSGIPTIFGVLTCETLEQAVERAGTKMGNAGADAALTAIETVNVLEQI
jgi:6,7-dimethyl-8-ribityllumazine synthase